MTTPVKGPPPPAGGGSGRAIRALYPPPTLIEAVHADNIVDVQAALAAGANVDDQDENGNTAVHLARSPEVLVALLHEGPDLDITNASVRTAAQEQAWAGRPELADIIHRFLSLEHVDGPYTSLKY